MKEHKYVPMANRVIRFTALPEGVIARFDHTRNLLVVDPEAYEKVPEIYKGVVLKSCFPVLTRRELFA